MDYTIQMENLYKFFALSLDAEDMYAMLKLKKSFNNDLNLFGCFIKDFLTLENNGQVPEDENLYNDFVIYFEKNFIRLKDILNKLKNYSKYYISLVFETVEHKEFLGYIRTINICFALDAYPCIMKIFDDYYNQRVDAKKVDKMLKSLTDIVIARIEKPEHYNINLFEELRNERQAS